MISKKFSFRPISPQVSGKNDLCSAQAVDSEFQVKNERVAVVLGFFDGKKYLPEQLRSILAQSHRDLEIFISDDNSSSEIDFDALDLSPEDAKKVHISSRNQNTGFVFNFLNALGSIDDSYAYFAFSDQDDVWHQEKLKDALAILEKHPENVPALYCARTVITDETCQTDLGTSPLFQKPPSFANAIVQNIGSGNTMVFNKAARDLVVSSSAGTEVVFHDWWCYQIISGAGGVIHYDSKPCLKYRQHSSNLIGSNNSGLARILRIRGLFKGNIRKWNDINLAALAKNQHLLTTENQRILSDFIAARKSNLLRRLYLFKRTGIYRQTFFSNLSLLLGLLINKV